MVTDELAEIRPGANARAQPYGCPGQVLTDAEELKDLLRLSTIHHILEVRREADARTLTDVEQVVSGVELPELREAASFRVTSKRAGDHRFSSVDLQRAAGAVLHRRYGTPVDLRDFDVEVRVNLYHTHLVVGLQRTRDSLGNRIHRARSLRSSLKPTIAAAMLRLVGAHEGEGRLLDPMCGAGTIPIEARRINPRLELFASDWDAETVEVARETLAHHGVEVELRGADARSLSETYRERFDYIAVDPPYGVRQARRTSLARLYRSLLPSFERVLTETGKIVLIVLKYRTFLKALEGTGLRVASERRIELGGLEPRIVILERV